MQRRARPSTRRRDTPGLQVHVVALFACVWRLTAAKEGCTDSAASNFNPSAENEDGSCTYGTDPCPWLNSKLDPAGATCFLGDANGTWAPAWPSENTGAAAGSLTLSNSEQWIVQGLPSVPKQADEGRPRPPGSTLPFRIHADPGAYLTLRYANIAPTEGRSEQGGGVYASGATVRLEAVVLEASSLSAHDGAGIFVNQKAQLFVIGCTLRTKSVKGGGISAQSQAEVTIKDSLFDGCTSFSHSGGAIYASPEPDTVGPEPFKQGTGGVKLDISNTTFRNSQGTASPPEQGGKALYLAECAQVKMVNTVFDPFDAKTVVTITPAEQLLVLAGSGCTQYPCLPGHACSYSRLSLQCTPCPPGTFGNGTGICQSCTPGQEPNEDLTHCVACTLGKYSQFGNLCQECSLGQFVNTGQTGCTACRAGEGPQGDECVKCSAGQYSSLGVSCEECKLPNVVRDGNTSCVPCIAGFGPVDGKCARCAGTNYSTLGQCQVCQWPNVVDEDHTSCTACKPGQEPNQQQSMCIDCTEAKFSSQGAQCELCSHPNVVNTDAGAARSRCFACPAGKGPTANQTRCVRCSIGANFSTFGSCQDCPAPNFVTEDRTQCKPCPAGKGPNRDRTGCDVCTKTGEYSSDGVCKPCSATNYVPRDRKTCNECPAGHSPSSDQTKCQPCKAGEYSHKGGACQECKAPNVVSANWTACTKCPNGQGVIDNKCETCTGRQYSVNGLCQECRNPGVVDASHTTCLTCTAGHAPNTTGIGCVKCTGATYSKFGDRCEECKLPNVVRDGNTSCEPCTAGFGPVDGKCVRCAGTNYSTLGQCQVCQWPNVVDEYRTTCTRCPPGQAPANASTRTSCATCIGSTYSTDGAQCIDCVYPMVFNDKRTACTRCTAGQGPTTNFSKCEPCQNRTVSTFGEPCKPCGADTTANLNHSNCVKPFGCLPGQQCKRGKGLCTHSYECEPCPPGFFSDRVGSECTQCSYGTGKHANSEHTACVPCPPGTAPSENMDQCKACTGTNYSRNGVQCVACYWPRILDAKRTECSECPNGKGPNEEQTDCNECIGNNHSTSGRCVPCKTGNIVSTDRTTCNECGDRKQYVAGYSDEHGVCGCASGYYDARTTLIVCLQNGFDSHQQDKEFDSMCDTGDLEQDNGTRVGANGSLAYAPVCLKCPECADCSGELFPALRDGYILGRTTGFIDSKKCAAQSAAGKNAEVAAQSRGIYYAFLCDADTAVTPSDVTEFTYFTNHQANERCNHNCTQGHDCNATLKPLTWHSSAAGEHTRSVASNSDCSYRFDGQFCQSCATGFYQTRGGKGTCKACEKQATNQFCARDGYNVCALSMVAVLLALPTFYGFVRCVRRWHVRLCRKKAMPTADRQHDTDHLRRSDLAPSLRHTRQYMEMSDATAWTFCGLSRKDLRMLRVAVFPAIKILITYFQVAGQLSSVLHVQYPDKFSEGVAYFRPLLDFYTVFFRADCTKIWGHHLGTFEAHWLLRMCGQPLVFWLLVEVICVVSVWAGYSTKAEARKSRTQNQLRACFMLYPTIVNLCFSTLNCIADSEDTKVLVDDDRVPCPDPHWSHWLSREGIRPFQLASIVILVFFGFGAPVLYMWRVFRASWNGAEEIRALHPVRDFASKELPDYPEQRKMPNGRISMRPTVQLQDMNAAALERVEDRAQMDDRRIRERVEALWRRTFRYSLYRACCCKTDVPVPDSFNKHQTDKLNLKLALSWRSAQVSEDVEAAYIESMKLQTFSSLTESYKPQHQYCYWEGVDLLRKFFLVGVVVLAGRGSILQNVVSTFLSFLFFAFHVKMWPHKTNEDNVLKAMCEVHIFWTITTAFVMRSDLTHERLKNGFYDWVLLLSFVVCVPLSVVLTVSSKLIRAKNAKLDPILEVPTDKRRWSPASDSSDDISDAALIPMHEFRMYTLGLASRDDRWALKDYFQAMLSTAHLRPEDDDDLPGSGTRVTTKKVIGQLLDELRYSEQEQEEILNSLVAEQRRQGGGNHLMRTAARMNCCLCRWQQCCGPAEDEGMTIYVEVDTQEGSRQQLQLVLENDGSETIEGVKQMIHDKLGTNENDKHLVLVFEDKRLSNNLLTVGDCGITSGDTLQLMQDGGITFKLLSREHMRREKLKKSEQERGEQPWLDQQQSVPNADDAGSKVVLDALEEPLMPAAVSATRPASPVTTS